MNEKDKANELVEKYCDIEAVDLSDAIYCAIIAINEKIDLLNELDEYFHEAGHDRKTLEKAMEIQLKVKQKLENYARTI